MDKEETKVCPNCKRDIPVSNYTIHCVHCARNIKVCPVCKEPVPHAELDDHHDKLHKLLPCKQCGESVCGTDLEDHIRDSCANTIKSCRYCSLELPRRDVPSHESYCGARTEQCADCEQYVMIKYRQLHLESNHGFLRLDDDPVPVPPKKEQPKPTIPKLTNIPKSVNLPSTSNGKPENTGINHPRTEIRYFNGAFNNTDIPGTSKSYNNIIENKENIAGSSKSVQNVLNGNKVPKRTNDQPQVNLNVATPSKVEKQLVRGAIKKRAPPPPTNPSPAAARAIHRQNKEKNEREEQNKRNAELGLPPILTAAEKVDRLRKMDALQNREVEDEYRDRLQGRVWAQPDFVNIGNVLGSQGNSNQSNHLAADRRRSDRGNGRISPEVARSELRGAIPMSAEQFAQRFQQLQVTGTGTDRYSEIKTSLTELRRGLNEVTAPYVNSNGNNGNNQNRRSPREDEVRLPCEFCGELLPEDDLVIHQTGCRPDLAQFRPVSPRRPRDPPRPPGGSLDPYVQPSGGSHDPYDQPPVIPCEFCDKSLPVYLITEHQEKCRRKYNYSPDLD